MHDDLCFLLNCRKPSQQGGRKLSSSPTKKTEEDSVHPSTLVKKDDFLDGLGLMSQEALQMKKLQSGKVERRRRTANTNPKYSSNGFLKFDDLVKSFSLSIQLQLFMS